MKEALITSDKGFLGRHIRKALEDQGWACTGMDIESDLDVPFKLEDKRFDLVVHCAAVNACRAATPVEGQLYDALNLSIDVELFNWALRNRPGRLVYFSSAAAYPTRYQTETNQFSLREGFIDLDDIQSPDRAYGWAKLTGEMLARQLRDAAVPVTVLRLFSYYGADQGLDHSWPFFIRQAMRRDDPFTIWGDGTQVRDWVHIDDVVGTTLTCIAEGIDGPLNVGRGRAITFMDLAEMCISTAEYSPAFDLKLDAPMGVHYRVADTDQLFEVYKPLITLEQMVIDAMKDISKRGTMESVETVDMMETVSVTEPMAGTEPKPTEPEPLTETETEGAGAAPEEPTIAGPQCGAWAFILAPMLGAFCPLAVGHEGDHQTVIKVFAEPKARFTVTWALGDTES